MTTEGAVSEFVTRVVSAASCSGCRSRRVAGRVHAGTADPGAAVVGEIAGVLNLRGRIVTAVVDMRARLGLPKNDDGKPPMAVGVDLPRESYGLLIDQIGEVLKLADDKVARKTTVNLDPPHGQARRRRASPRRSALMVVLDVDQSSNSCRPCWPRSLNCNRNAPGEAAMKTWPGGR